MTDLDAVVTVLVEGDRAAVLETLIGLDDRQRKAFGPTFRKWLTQGTTVRVGLDRQALAVLATAGGHRQATVATRNAWNLGREFVVDAVNLLEKRSPPWLPEFVDGMLQDDTAWSTWNWRLARGLVRAGLVEVPDNLSYFRGTVRGLPDYSATTSRPLVEEIAADPGLIGDHLIGMVSTEGAGRLLAFHDGFQKADHHQAGPFLAGTWRIALITLAQEGRLDRNRLLDAVLAAPLRDWAAADLGWYVGMHDALAPTLDEVAERQATYARLLTVEHGPSVKLAQRELLRLVEDPRLEPALLLDASRATLVRSDKASVAAQLRLLARLAKERPELPVTGVVRVAADHPRADVREQSRNLLARLGEAEPPPVQPVTFVAPVPEPRPPAPEIVPLTDPDELAEVLLALIEELDAVELERAIDGLLRFADDRPRTADLLLARTAQAERYPGDPRIAAVVLARAWLTPRRRFRAGEWPIVLGHSTFPARTAEAGSLVGALGRRLAGIAHAVRRGPHLSVALPSTLDGSLDAETLNRRLHDARKYRAPAELEVALALLRVPVADRTAAAVPRSLRSREVRRVLAGHPADWARLMVAYRRSPFDREPTRMPVFADRAAREGDALDGILARRRPERNLEHEHGYGEYEPRFEQTLALAALLLPHDPDVLAAHGHPYLHRDLRKDRAAGAPLLDALARTRTALGGPASSALVLGLAAQDARARTAAQDALIDRAGHGVLDGGEIGRQAGLHLGDDLVVGQRVATGLAEVARAGDAAVVPVLDALEALLPVLPGRRDAGAFLRTAADLAERTGRKVALPNEFRELAGGRSSSLLARAARRFD